jgi:hypothetical protein
LGVVVLFLPWHSLFAQGNGGQIATKLSQTSASINDQFSLTVEIPGGCDIPSVVSDDFGVMASRDFRQEAPRQYPHLQPTGHVQEVVSHAPSVFSGVSPGNNHPPSADSPAAYLRTYVFKARRAGALTVGPFHVLCPDGPLETQPQSILISDDESLTGKVVAIQDFSARRSPSAAAPSAPAAAETPLAAMPRTPLAGADPTTSLAATLGDAASEKNLLILAVVGLGTAVLVLLLRGSGKSS